MNAVLGYSTHSRMIQTMQIIVYSLTVEREVTAVSRKSASRLSLRPRHLVTKQDKNLAGKMQFLSL